MRMCPLVFYFRFLVNHLHFTLSLIIHFKNHVSYHYLYIIIAIITIFLFFQHYHSLGESSANEFEWCGLPLPIDSIGLAVG